MLFANNNNLKELSNVIRFLSIDAVERAASGHPGMPMGFADVATILFSEFLRFNPQDPSWPNRDRFILSAGHGAMLLYSILYLTGYDLSIEDIKNFRQLNSRTPGHPEYGHTPGVETSTGPLGQGLANAVGMAIGQKMLQARHGKEVIDAKTYVVVGDGCLMEGISYEACSLAGHLQLSNLIALYDSNKISIDGSTDLTFTENVKERFIAQNWEVFSANGHDYDEIRGALYKATKSNKPSIIIFNTKIGFGSPGKEGSEKAHGSPLGAEEVKLVRQKLNYNYPPFEVPENLLEQWRNIGNRHLKSYKEWNDLYAFKFRNTLNTEQILQKLDELEKKYDYSSEEATRKSMHRILNEVMSICPDLVGGSADLSESNGTKTSDARVINKDNFLGNYIHYGVREHAMAAIMNGLTLGGFKTFAGTFLVFADYMRPAIRLSALMNIPVVYLFSHDSIGVGEDGPTHQPVEHLGSLRAIPNLTVYRPANARETILSFKNAVSNLGPSVIILSRQNLPQVEEFSSEGEKKIDILASGSEVHIAVEAGKKLALEGYGIKVFSVMDLKNFDKSTLTPGAKKIAIEASNDPYWREIIGESGIFIGMQTFGASGKAKDLFNFFKINVENIIDRAKSWI